jgi:hypothetical protein
MGRHPDFFPERILRILSATAKYDVLPTQPESLPSRSLCITVAMLSTTAKILTLAMVELLSGAPMNESAANDVVANLFAANGWQVAREQLSPPCDLVISKSGLSYVVEIKMISEGRPDRVIALLSQAILQAQAHARPAKGLRPLAIVYVGAAAQSLLDKVDQFSRQYAPKVAIGVLSRDGVRHFIGSGLEALNARPERSSGNLRVVPRMASDLFSDLNQWMLKVLLAPELPEYLLAAPRAEYRNASELSKAANVSLMSASRFVSRLREEGLIHDVAGKLRLVQRARLFDRWRSAAQRSSPEVRMCFLNPGAGRAQLHRIVASQGACLGLFAAADVLHVGHVSGVPPYAYVRKLPRSDRDSWPGLVFAREGESANLILRQANARESVFRGAVEVDGMKVSDVLQIWLDASAHPSRGKEQAEFLERKVLRAVLGVDK